MARTGGTPKTRTNIFDALEEMDRLEYFSNILRINKEKWRRSTNKKITIFLPQIYSFLSQVTKFRKRCVSKQTSAPDKAKKTSETVKISADKQEAPIKWRRTAKKMTKFREPEDENRESMDSGFGESQPRVNHRYPTRARIAAQATQNDDQNQTKSSSAKPAKPKRFKNPPDFDKENDGKAANGTQLRQGTSSNKSRLSGLPVSRPVSQNVATPEESNSTKERFSQCSSDDWIEHIRWLQPRRDVGLWIECTRKGCGKWRYAENYHDPLDVPKIWFCEMNTDARFADCSIPQDETSEAEGRWYIENAYNAGSIVWAKVNGFPWWPAMVDDCPELLKYWDIRGSSIVPHKYHVKFFNEMKIAWMPLRNLKPYAENPRSTFLKKTVFRRKDYSDELDAACEVANQALPLTLLERLKRFSWATLISSGVREENESLVPRNKTKKSSNKSTIDPTILTRAADNAVPSPISISTRKRPVDKHARKNVKRNTKTNDTENVTDKQTINIRSRIINLEADSAINSRPSTSQHFNSQSSPSWDKASFPEPNEFNANSIDRSEVDNSNNDDAPVQSPASKSTQSTYEKRKCSEDANNQRCTKRVTIEAIGALAKKIRDSRQSYAKKATNFRAATQIENPSNQSVVNLRSRVDAPANIGPTVSGREDGGRFSRNDSFVASASRPVVLAGTEELAVSPREPIEIDRSGSSTDFEEYNNRREYPDYPNRAEIRDNSQLSNPIFALTSNGSRPSFGSIKSWGSSGSLPRFSQPERNETSDRCPSSCGLCALSVDLGVSDSGVDAAVCIEPTVSVREDRERFFAYDVFAASTPRPEVRHSRSASPESGGDSSFRMNSASLDEGFGRSGGGSEIDYSAGGSEINDATGGSEINYWAGGSEINYATGGSEINYWTGGSETNFFAGGSETNFFTGRSEINDSADGSEGASSFRMNSETVGKRSGRFLGGSETNFSAGGSETNFFAGRSEINLSAGGSETNFPAGSETNFSAGGSKSNPSASKDVSTSSSREPILIDLTDFRTGFEGNYHQREYPDYPSHAQMQADSQSFDPRLASTSHRFGPTNKPRQFSPFKSFKSFGSLALPSQPECDEMSQQLSNNSGWCVPLVDLEVSGPRVSANALPEQDYLSPPNCAVSWSSHEPASSEYASNVNKFSLLDILTRCISSGSSQSSDSIVPSSQPDMDRAFERRPRFPSLCNRRRDLRASTSSLSSDTNVGSPTYTSSKHLLEVITIDD